MKQFITDCEKLQKVVTSCKSEDQLRSAWRYYKLWEKKYPLEDMPKWTLVTGLFTDGFVIGYFRGRTDL